MKDQKRRRWWWQEQTERGKDRERYEEDTEGEVMHQQVDEE